MKIVELKNVSRYYKAGQQQNYALKNVSFGIEEGEFVVILGASGAGKSTMLNLLGGIDRADEGEILIAGQDIAKLSEKELSKYRAKRVGFVFQFYNLIPTLTVKENVELMRELKKDALGASEALQKVLLVTHNANIARAADRVIHVRSGEIKEIQCNADPCSMKEVEW